MVRRSRLPTEQFRQARVRECVHGIKEARRNLIGLILEAVHLKAKRGDSVIVGPDRADVIAERIETCVAAGEGPHAPPA